MIRISQGRDEEQGFTGPNKEQPQGRGGRKHGHGFTFWHCTSGEAGKKEAFGGAKGKVRAKNKTIRAVSDMAIITILQNL
jgi:hypothetical protein